MSSNLKLLLLVLIGICFGCGDSSMTTTPKNETKHVNPNKSRPKPRSKTPSKKTSPTDLSLTAPENFDDGDRGNSLTASPTLTWNPVNHAVSYEIAIGTNQGDTDILDWTDIGDTTSFSKNSLTIPNGLMIYASVRAVGSDGTKSSSTEGDGWQNLKCPVGYIKIVGNETPSLGGTNYSKGTKSLYDWDGLSESLRNISDFCVMKYEAKDSGDASWALRAVSTAAGLPWVSIQRTQAGPNNDAVEACEAIGSDYYLVNNQHWQAIARDIESVSGNFNKSGALADHAFNRGQSNGAAALAADVDDSNGCSNIGSSTHNSSAIAADCGGGWHLNKRTHSLSNGEVIWDLAGNVWEWIRDDNTTAQGSDDFIRAAPYHDALKWGPADDYSAQTGSTEAGLGYGVLSYNGGAVLRGGSWNNSADVGVFNVDLYDGPAVSYTNLGFRCVFAP